MRSESVKDCHKVLLSAKAAIADEPYIVRTQEPSSALLDGPLHRCRGVLVPIFTWEAAPVALEAAVTTIRTALAPRANR
jgi:hypothetical protein